MSLPSVPAELQAQLKLMLTLRRWGERLMIIPLILGGTFVVCTVNYISLLDQKQDSIGYYLVYGAFLLLWVVLLAGLLLAAQIFRTAYLAFGLPRALGYVVLATIFAAVPTFFYPQWVATIQGSSLVFLLWFGLFLVPSLIKEEIHRRHGLSQSADATIQ